MKLKALESELSAVSSFDAPKIELEQISTSAHIASRMLFTASQTYDDIEGCVVGDFGCGAGMLSIGSSMLGSAYTIGFDVDIDALNDAWVNVKTMELDESNTIDFVQCDISTLPIAAAKANMSSNCNSCFDTVVMNPPFGTRNKGIDTLFVQKGMENASVVYSLHKTSTRDHFSRFAAKNDYHIEVIAELRYDIPKTFHYHKKQSKDIQVDLLRFSHKS